MLSSLRTAASGGPVLFPQWARVVMCSTFLPTGSVDRELEGWLGELADCPGCRVLPDLSAAVLLLLDLQRLFIDPSSPAYLQGWSQIAPRCHRLLAAFRAAGRPVIFTRHLNPPGDDGGVITHFGGRPLRAGDPLAELHSELVPAPGEPVLDKARYSAWWRTGLEDHLPVGSVVVLAGVTTHRCVLAAAVGAASRDRLPVVAADACATRSAALQLAALRTIAHGFGHVASTREVLRGLRPS